MHSSRTKKKAVQRVAFFVLLLHACCCRASAMIRFNIGTPIASCWQIAVAEHSSTHQPTDPVNVAGLILSNLPSKDTHSLCHWSILVWAPLKAALLGRTSCAIDRRSRYANAIALLIFPA
ncbi:hypothetical protein [Moorena producens]|uniref:hypothetical protein n=1 Tax=Moorena producens TaxID=1155739 RepID=UPI0011EA6597|nr:hypothetical protein [Moorena producens]